MATVADRRLGEDRIDTGDQLRPVREPGQVVVRRRPLQRSAVRRCSVTSSMWVIASATPSSSVTATRVRGPHELAVATEVALVEQVGVGDAELEPGPVRRGGTQVLRVGDLADRCARRGRRPAGRASRRATGWRRGSSSRPGARAPSPSAPSGTPAGSGAWPARVHAHAPRARSRRAGGGWPRHRCGAAGRPTPRRACSSSRRRAAGAASSAPRPRCGARWRATGRGPSRAPARRASRSGGPSARRSGVRRARPPWRWHRARHRHRRVTAPPRAGRRAGGAARTRCR